MSPKRGEIYWLFLGDTQGSEQQGRRPVLVIQNNIGNEIAPTTIVTAITTKSFTKEYPVNVNIPKSVAGLKENSTVLLSQIRTVDQSRLKKKIGELPTAYMQKIDEAIKVSLGL